MGEHPLIGVRITGFKPFSLKVGEKIDGATRDDPLRIARNRGGEIREISAVTRDMAVVNGTGSDLVIKKCFGSVRVGGGTTGSRVTLIAPSWAVLQGRRDGETSVIIAVPKGLGPKQRGVRHWWCRVRGGLRRRNR